MRIVMMVIMFFLFTACSSTTKKYHEKHYQTLLCDELGGKMEYVLKDRTRVDCLTDEQAIEVDFTKKWAESIGQSLYYANMTDRKPAVGLIVDNQKDKRNLKRLNFIAKKYGIKVLVIEK